MKVEGRRWLSGGKFRGKDASFGLHCVHGHRERPNCWISGGPPKGKRDRKGLYGRFVQQHRRLLPNLIRHPTLIVAKIRLLAHGEVR